jgi:hypothetical protein
MPGGLEAQRMSHFKPNTLGLVAVAVGLVACGGTESTPLGLDGPSLATRIHPYNAKVEFTMPGVDNPCTPAIETIDLQGVIHVQGSQ